MCGSLTINVRENGLGNTQTRATCRTKDAERRQSTKSQKPERIGNTDTAKNSGAREGHIVKSGHSLVGGRGR